MSPAQSAATDRQSDAMPGPAGATTVRTPLHEIVIPAFTQGLANLGGQLDKAAGGPGGLGRLLDARLAPDMHPLSAQIAYACLQGRECVARLLGAPIPPPPDARSPGLAREALEVALSELWECDSAALDRAAGRPVELRLPDGLVFDLTGRDYVRDWALPQFYFHLVTAYGILRSQGVPLGKADYVPHMFRYLRPQG